MSASAMSAMCALACWTGNGAQVSDKGLFISEPDALLDAWRDAYEPPAGKRMGFYTTLHGSAFEEAARQALHAGPENGQAVFASFSAAHWLAPYGRTGMQYFYADNAGLERLQVGLKLSSSFQRRERRGHYPQGSRAVPRYCRTGTRSRLHESYPDLP